MATAAHRPMPLLSQSVKEAFESRATASSASAYLNPGDINEGDKVRITFLGDDSVAGWEIWADGPNGKRLPLRFANEPTRAEIDKRAAESAASVPADSNARAFFSFAVWNYNISKVQVFQFSQTSLAKPLIEALSDEEIEAEPSTYDFAISASGTGRDKRYSVVPLPGKRRQAAMDATITEAWEAVIKAGFNLGVVLSGGDPFKGSI